MEPENSNDANSVGSKDSGSSRYNDQTLGRADADAKDNYDENNMDNAPDDDDNRDNNSRAGAMLSQQLCARCRLAFTSKANRLVNDALRHGVA